MRVGYKFTSFTERFGLFLENMSSEIFAFLSFLCTELVIELYRRHCPGCIDGKRATINHLCSQRSLLDKFEAKYDKVSKKIALAAVPVVNRFVSIYPEFTGQEDGLTNTVNNFLLCSTAKSIYFGEIRLF